VVQHPLNTLMASSRQGTRMLNPIEEYRRAGRAAAIAKNQGDEARANHWAQWARKAYWLESAGDDRDAAQTAFDDAYRESRKVPKPSLFR
jgi:hypothetical protein